MAIAWNRNFGQLQIGTRNLKFETLTTKIRARGFVWNYIYAMRQYRYIQPNASKI
ncbi:hypothetical protein WG66_002389, partial [Moniliophthora roreri]